MSTLQYEPGDIDPGTIEAAIKLENYFKKHGITDWALMGVCSRNCHTERDRLKQQVEQLREACGRASGWLMSLPPHTIGHCIGEQCQQALKETEL